MIRRLAGSPVLRLFSVAVIDQAMLSIANFGVVLVLIRYTEMAQYGTYVLVQVSIALLVSAQGAWLAGPLSVLAPKRDAAQRDQMLAVVNHGHRLWSRRLLPLALLVPPGGWALGLWDAHMAALAASSVLLAGAGLRRELGRAHLLIQSRPRQVLTGDAIYLAVMIVGVALAITLSDTPIPWAVLAQAAGALAGSGHLFRALGLPEPAADAPAREVWKDMRPLGTWGTVGATVYWVQSQAFNYLLAIRMSAASVGHVNSVRLLMMPVFLLATGVSSQLLPVAAAWLHEHGLRRLLRRLMFLAAGLLVLDLAYIAVLWLARDLITVDLMAKQIPGRDVLILLWASHAILGMLHTVFQAALLALERFKVMAYLNAIAAVSSLLVMWFAVQAVGAPGAVIGTAAGEGVYLLGILLLLAQSLKRAPPAN